MNVLLSGATGFIGAHLLRRLLDDGHHCRCLVRSKKNASEWSSGGNIEVVAGDVTRPETLEGIGRDMDAACHLAGAGHVSSVHGGAALAAAAANVRGTRCFAAACGRDGVRRFVHFSSTAAMGLIKRRKIDETVPCRPATPYQKSKYESELAAFEEAERFGMELLVLRPCMVYGPGGKGEFLKFCRLIRMGLFPRIGFGSNLTPIVHVSDVVRGAVNAIHCGDGGEVYVIASEHSLPMAVLHKVICDAMGIWRPYIYIPRTAALTGAFLAEAASRLTKREPVVSRKNIVSTFTGREFDIRKAKRGLNYAPRTDIRTGVRETIAWYRRERLLPLPRTGKRKGRLS